MELEETSESDFTLPFLSKLERLDHLVQLLEGKYSLSEKHLLTPGFGNMLEHKNHRRTLSEALREVHLKGTLMDRLEMLEKRVFKLGLNMVQEKYSRSSSSDRYKHPKIQEEITTEEYALIIPKDNQKRGKPKRKWRSMFGGFMCSN